MNLCFMPDVYKNVLKILKVFDSGADSLQEY